MERMKDGSKKRSRNGRREGGLGGEETWRRGVLCRERPSHLVSMKACTSYIRQ